MTGRIIKVARGSFHVETASGVVVCRTRGNLRLAETSPCAGDFVTISQTEADTIIEKILPRRNFIPRPPAANIDLLLFVVSVCEPRPNTAVLDTMTVLAQLAEVPVAIALTKCDLAMPEPWKNIYRRAGFPVYCLCRTDSNKTDDLVALRNELHDRTVLLAGNSGAGKSTLLNRILPELGQETAEISHKLGRGKHTTRQTAFFRTDNMLLGDSPGFSSLDLAQQGVKRQELAEGFREFTPYFGQCRFQDCTHLREPGCTVRKAAEAGEIPLERYENYVRFYKALPM
ncbi:MAG: ribosome small subunit-dependent GTPase A [Oscillospiraceae bacterium]|nr:ribosome small subunit-dependent GTPase A [Oscillospiraceae bacterium]